MRHLTNISKFILKEGVPKMFKDNDPYQYIKIFFEIVTLSYSTFSPVQFMLQVIVL